MEIKIPPIYKSEQGVPSRSRPALACLRTSLDVKGGHTSRSKPDSIDFLGMAFKMGHTRWDKINLSHATYTTTASSGIKRSQLLSINVLHMVP